MDSSWSVNVYSLLILVGAVHGLILVVLLSTTRRFQRLSNAYLALMLLFYTLPVLRVMLIDIGVVDASRVVFPVELLYGLGPALYMFTRATAAPQSRIGRGGFLHFVPVTAEFMYYLSPLYQENAYRFIAAPIDGLHLTWMVEQLGAILSVLVYLFLTHRMLWLPSPHTDRSSVDARWLRIPVLLYTAFFLLWLGLRFIDVVAFGDRLTIPTYYPFLVFLSYSTYGIGTWGYLRASYATATPRKPSPRSDSLAEDEALLASLFGQLEALMAEKEPYLDSGLTLSGLSGHLGVDQRLVSRVINIQAGVNFYDYVNRYRVEAFKRRIAKEVEGGPLLAVAHDCGFGSKATFNHAFKKLVGSTPSQYRRQIQGGRAVYPGTIDDAGVKDG